MGYKTDGQQQPEADLSMTVFLAHSTQHLLRVFRSAGSQACNQNKTYIRFSKIRNNVHCCLSVNNPCGFKRQSVDCEGGGLNCSAITGPSVIDTKHVTTCRELVSRHDVTLHLAIFCDPCRCEDSRDLTCGGRWRRTDENCWTIFTSLCFSLTQSVMRSGDTQWRVRCLSGYRGSDCCVIKNAWPWSGVKTELGLILHLICYFRAGAKQLFSS